MEEWIVRLVPGDVWPMHGAVFHVGEGYSEKVLK